MLDSKGFDLWADGYDKSVAISEESKEYPFAGYKKVLNHIYNEVRKKNKATVLDIGFGTGVLTTELYNAGSCIVGIDFSSNMIEIAKQKMPQALLINWDLTKGLPDIIRNNRFDYIISTYAIHHLSDEEKIIFIKSLIPLLNEKGKILIGDVSFETRSELEKCKEKYKEQWDDDEFYFAAEEIRENFSSEYICRYTKISLCAGILTISNMQIK
jgi:putative AdoMet-dependent methyltransferase